MRTLKEKVAKLYVQFLRAPEPLSAGQSRIMGLFTDELLRRSINGSNNFRSLGDFFFGSGGIVVQSSTTVDLDDLYQI